MADSSNLPALVRRRFHDAQEAGDLTFYPTKVAVLHTCGAPFQIRFSPALADKPKAAKDPNSKPVDVFDNPRKLLVTQWPPAHNLVLNKFAINACHFILATQKFEEQTHLLCEDDFDAAYQCLNAYKEHGENLFAFFNSGEHSGASQRRRHIQFLPVNSMENGIEKGDEWKLLTDELAAKPSPTLPFKYFSAPLPPSPTPRQIHDIYLSLYASAVKAVEEYKPEAANPSDVSNASARISYNLAMTDRVLAVCPRLHEGCEISDAQGNVLGFAALNGTLLGGTLLVKSEVEYNTILKNESMLGQILENIGIPQVDSGP